MKMNINTNRLLLAALTEVVGAGIIAYSLDENVSAQTDEVKAVTDVLTREAVAVEKGDLAALDKIWANSEDVGVFESGHANYGWTDYRNTHLAPELKEFKNRKYSFSDLKVKVDGKTAWATFKYALAAEMGTRKVESGGLVKKAEALEILEKVNTIVVDKTGTLTEGKPRLQKVVVLSDVDETEILRLAASLERSSEHPLAEATIKGAEERNIDLAKV